MFKATDTTLKKELLSELEDQAINPPGGDKIIGLFYKAWINLIIKGAKEKEFLLNILSKHRRLTNKHLVNILFRAFQYLKLELSETDYRGFIKVQQWEKEILRIYKNKNLRKKLENILLYKTTTTTIYQRYAGPYSLISLLYENKPVTVVDLGCGGNYGLRGIYLNLPFEEISDETQGNIVTKAISKKIKLKKSLAIDKEDPDDEEVKRWRWACSFYPKELDKLIGVKTFEEKISKCKNVRFTKMDLLTFDWYWLKKKSTDVAILSTILYQLSEGEQNQLLENTKLLLKKNGILIVQDFAVKDINSSGRLHFGESWFGREYSYRTFVASAKTNWKFLEALLWLNGRCKKVKTGEDFLEIIKLCSN